MKQQCQGVQWNYKTCLHSVLNMTADVCNFIWISSHKIANRKVTSLCMMPQYMWPWPSLLHKEVQATFLSSSSSSFALGETGTRNSGEAKYEGVWQRQWVQLLWHCNSWGVKRTHQKWESQHARVRETVFTAMNLASCLANESIHRFQACWWYSHKIMSRKIVTFSEKKKKNEKVNIQAKKNPNKHTNKTNQPTKTNKQIKKHKQTKSRKVKISELYHLFIFLLSFNLSI